MKMATPAKLLFTASICINVVIFILGVVIGRGGFTCQSDSVTNQNLATGVHLILERLSQSEAAHQQQLHILNVQLQEAEKSLKSECSQASAKIISNIRESLSRFSSIPASDIASIIRESSTEINRHLSSQIEALKRQIRGLWTQMNAQLESEVKKICLNQTMAETNLRRAIEASAVQTKNATLDAMSNFTLSAAKLGALMEKQQQTINLTSILGAALQEIKSTDGNNSKNNERFNPFF